MNDEETTKNTISIGGDNSGTAIAGNNATVHRTEVVDITDSAASRVDEARASRIFISHAHADAALAEPLLELLRLGAGAGQADIFCSSLPGHDIPPGARWLDVLANELDGCELVVLLITPAYLESTFCMCELGALWIKAIPNVPLAVPPVEPGDLTGILGQTQVLSLSRTEALDQLGMAVAGALDTQLNPSTWNRRQAAFRTALSTFGAVDA